MPSSASAPLPQYAGLPELSGRKPFGGHIMSHDFVEAALMRRGGWAIHMAPTLGGSYEECPPTLLGFRHPRPALVPGQPAAPGGADGARPALDLAPASSDRHRLLSHRAALADFPADRNPDFVAGAFVRPEYFPKGFSLFPQWPAKDPVLAAWVFVGTMGMLIVPKLLAFILLLTRS